MSHYIGIDAKIKVRKEFQNLFSSDCHIWEEMEKSSDEILRRIAKWHRLSKYTGCAYKLKYDLSSNILTVEYGFDVRYYWATSDIVADCLLPYITEEVIEECTWDDCDPIPEPYAHIQLKKSIENREELIEDISEELDEWFEEHKEEYEE